MDLEIWDQVIEVDLEAAWTLMDLDTPEASDQVQILNVDSLFNSFHK
jgi:hypothetical protein